jgi:alpha-D-ribose 1-methylphosphonate 5-triphosphate synthase subunit PhnH
MGLQSAIRPGFGDAVAQSQAMFRLAMQAMARPGKVLNVGAGLLPPAPLGATAGALLLTLCDFETSVWLDPALAEGEAVAQFIRFHTGARLVASPADAAYAAISDAARMPPLASFAQGTPEYPDRSATLILQVRELKSSGWRLEGPGIDGHALFSASPLPSDFVQQARANRGQFPCGVDMFFTTNAEMAALPRSTRLTETV